jgi:integrase
MKSGRGVTKKRDRRDPRERKRARILSDDEIRQLWNAAPEVHPSFGALVKMLVLTGQRLRKVARMRWDDLKAGTWTMPAEKREKGTGGNLALPKVALEIIDQQPRIAGNPHVFPARGKGPFNSFSQRKEELDQKLREVLPDMTPWVFHDLRRTARSLMSRAGVRPDIAERVLGHAIAGVEGVYDRHSYDVEKADALNRLAHLVDAILSPPADNVVPLPERQAIPRQALAT